MATGWSANTIRIIIWQLIESLQKEEVLSRRLLVQLEAGLPVRSGRRRYRALNDKISTIEAQRVAGEINVPDFLTAIGNFMQF